ncbi:heme-binding protein [Pseudomonas sp. BN515]|uniref:GlcG/HbpS family heme-binding protein n=1 Tax=Pseudomonas sp. BN515 TaxID=2567892 RepID=UPI002458F0A1|nr:heme-binding protein [Pseudomonas sp. BN515]MDH4873293.1 heme-binding protein [Pseudomonas sp. BN515]
MKPLQLLALSSLAVCLCAQAEIPSEKYLPLSVSTEIASATVKACTAKGYNVTAAVVDRAGGVRVVMRADKAGPHTLDSARRKAYTSASTKRSTSEILENVQKNPASQHLPMIDGFLILAGGVPIKVGDEVIGAVGVGGAPGGHLDEQCANAGLEAVKDQLK